MLIKNTLFFNALLNKNEVGLSALESKEEHLSGCGSSLAAAIMLDKEDLTREVTERWINSDNIWLQRSAIIF